MAQNYHQKYDCHLPFQKVFSRKAIFSFPDNSKGLSRIDYRVDGNRTIITRALDLESKPWAKNNGNFFEPGNISMLENAILNLIFKLKPLQKHFVYN